MTQEIDELISAAEEVRKNARGSNVSVAIRDSDGIIWRSAGITSADHVVGQCAEQTALFFALSNGAREIEVAVIVYDDEPVVHPCGACLEAFNRFSPKVTIFVVKSKRVLGPYRVTDLLPSV